MTGIFGDGGVWVWEKDSGRFPGLARVVKAGVECEWRGMSGSKSKSKCKCKCRR